jgi:predicted nuclease with TOPRIM domain
MEEAVMGLKEAYQEKIDAQLREWAAKLDELKAKADQAGADAKIDIYQRVEALRPQLEAVQAKLVELEQAGSERWEQLRGGLDQALLDLQTAWEDTAPPRAEYQEKIEAQIKAWAEKLSDLTAKAGQASLDVKAKMLREIEELHGRKDELQQRLNELKTTGADKWESLKGSAEKGMEDLKKTWESFKTRYL